jgi:hypothetical protein
MCTIGWLVNFRVFVQVRSCWHLEDTPEQRRRYITAASRPNSGHQSGLRSEVANSAGEHQRMAEHRTGTQLVRAGLVAVHVPAHLLDGCFHRNTKSVVCK